MTAFKLLWLLLSHANITFPNASSFQYFSGVLDAFLESGYLDSDEYDCILEKVHESALPSK